MSSNIFPINVTQALKIAIEKYKLDLYDARILLTHVLKCSKEYLIAYNETSINKEQLNLYYALCEKRSYEYPIAYILGYKEFYSLDFKVNEDVLIPRPETELLVDFAIEQLKINHNLKILDMGTGSGAIAISIANFIKQNKLTASVFACDVSTKALEVAQYNAQYHKVNVQFIHSDWFSNINTYTTQQPHYFDLIISNPPYIDKDDVHLDTGIRFEPRIALTDEDNGLSHINTIIEQGKKYMSAKAYMIFEHAYNQAHQVANIFVQNKYINIAHLQDLSRHMRATMAQNS